MKILFDSNGNLGIFMPSSFSDCGLTLEQILQKDFPKKPDGSLVPHKIIQDSEWNIDNLFINVYTFDPQQGAVFNSEPAKEIWKAKWREARLSLLQQLDIEYMKALESQDSQWQHDVVAKKEALRNVTMQQIPGNTPEEIRNFWPEILGPNPYAS